jgi:membrane-associated phospholipid phosphatase
MQKILLFLFVFSSGSTFAQNTDIDLLKEINGNRNTALDPAFRAITHSAAPLSMSAPAIIWGIGFLKKDTVTKHKGLYIGASLFASTLISTGLKYGIDRPRPFDTYADIQKETSADSPSFPSGHSSSAFSTATSLSLAFPKWYVIAPSYAWASAVAYSRMNLGVHYPSDVMVGIFIGSSSAILSYKAQQWLYKKRKNKSFNNSL